MSSGNYVFASYMTRRRTNINGQARNAVLLIMLLVVGASKAEGAGIEVYPKNRTYWQYDAKPVMLLSGTGDEADKYLTPNYRKPWVVPEKV